MEIWNSYSHNQTKRSVNDSHNIVKLQQEHATKSISYLFFNPRINHLGKEFGGK